MPPPSQPAPLYKRAIDLASDVATGHHALSKFVPPALWLVDAALNGLIIWKIPCELLHSCRTVPEAYHVLS